MDHSERNQAVEWAKQELAQIFASDALLNALTPKEERRLEFVDTLAELHDKIDNKWQHATSKAEDLAKFQIESAWRAGMAPDASDREKPQKGYAAYLAHLLAASDDDPVSFDALCIHGATLLGEGVWPAPSLREFLQDVLTGNRSMPKRPGRSSNIDVRDQLIHEVIHEVHLRFGVTPTRSEGPFNRGSACDIVADAMIQLRRTPSSYRSMRRIWARSTPSFRDRTS